MGGDIDRGGYGEEDDEEAYSDAERDEPVSDAALAAAAAAAELEMDPEVRRMRRSQHVSEVKVRCVSASVLLRREMICSLNFKFKFSYIIFLSVSLSVIFLSSHGFVRRFD